MQNYVFLLNADKLFLNMIPAARARVLQSKGKAAVFRRYPYVLILKQQIEDPTLKKYRLKIDKKTGKKVVTQIKPKTNYSHAKAGDIVKVAVKEDRKPRKKDESSDESKIIKVGMYISRVKTPTPKGVEVVVQGRRITAQLKQIQFLHRSDGYAYRFAPALSSLLQDNATS